ncbi:uncharacterized protein PRCAT00002826001 [Priceomyces carsonii]|uniref:uncharacterized protein n=1 Tax=Priceomyces carsonii TaxID=28549 RepID=UPI002ED88C6A|nr:unnamed protein product [Priceomyces carsonii]
MEDSNLNELHKYKGSGDLEKSSQPEFEELRLKPVSSIVKRKLILNVVIETTLSIVFYHYYEKIEEVNLLLAPALLGASTAALAQSFNQAQKLKYSINRVLKFTVWGIINGTLTALWINLLMQRIKNLSYRILVDQLLGVPIFQLIFNVLNSLWDQGELGSNTRINYLKALRYSYFFWPFFSICLFLFFPQRVMFPANCLANLIWNLILSMIA